MSNNVINKRISELIERYIDDIDQNNWEYVYEQLVNNKFYTAEEICLFTLHTVDAGINPLLHMSYVPSGFLYNAQYLGRLEKMCLYIPDHIKEIKDCAFYNSGIIDLTLPQSLEKVGYKGIFSKDNSINIHIKDIHKTLSIEWKDGYNPILMKDTNLLFYQNGVRIKAEVLVDDLIKQATDSTIYLQDAFNKISVTSKDFNNSISKFKNFIDEYYSEEN